MCLTNVIKTYRNSFTSWIGRNFLFSWDFFLLSLLPPTFVSHRVWIKEMILFSGLFSRNLRQRKKQTPIRKTDPNQEPVHLLKGAMFWCTRGAVNGSSCLTARTPSGQGVHPPEAPGTWRPSYCPSSDMESPQPLLLPHCTWGNTAVYHSPRTRLVISYLHLSLPSSAKQSINLQPLPPFL